MHTRTPGLRLRVDKWTAEVFAERGRRYVFCSARSRERFEQGPERYLRRAAGDPVPYLIR